MDCDVAIVGGGMVGASLALALADSGLSILLVEGTAPDSSMQPSFDDRTTALGNASRRIFQALGVWPAIAPQAAAITTIHVSDAGRFGFARLRRNRGSKRSGSSFRTGSSALRCGESLPISIRLRCGYPPQPRQCR